MIEANVYQALADRGRPISARDLAAFMGRAYSLVSAALQRLKKRNAAVMIGARKIALWVALPGKVISDGRGQAPCITKQARLAKFEPERIVTAPVHGSALAQALAWGGDA